MGPLSRIPPRAPSRQHRLDAQTKAKRHAREKADAEAELRNTEIGTAVGDLETEITGDPRFANSLQTTTGFGFTSGEATGDVSGTYNRLTVRAGSMVATWFPNVENLGRVLPGEVSVRLANFPERTFGGAKRRALPDGVQMEMEDVIGGILAGRVTDGVFDAARIPGLGAGKIIAGTFSDARIPSLSASKVTSGVFGKDRIPTVDNDMIGFGAVGQDKIHSSIKSADADVESLRRIGLGSGPRVAGENHSHSTSYALRFEALPDPVRASMLRERETLSAAITKAPAQAQGVQWSPQEKRAVMRLVALLLHVSLDGLTEGASERQQRRAKSRGLNRYFRRKTFEMLKSEITEGTTVVEEATPKLSEMAGHPDPEWDAPLPRFARAVPAELAP